jgi:hypothetical protein
MNLDDKIIDRLQKLIEQGQNIPLLRIQRSPSAVNFGTPVDRKKANRWGISCLNILSRIFGKDSDHYIKFDLLFPKIDDWTPLQKALGILIAAKDDYENGYLFDTRMLIEAEVFDDFLEQAEHLFDSKYYGPSAVIAGSVLEDGLRKLCQRQGIPLSPRPKLDSMNSELAKAGLYNTLVQKRITAIADIRNKAAHGKWSEFTKDDVQQMITQVRSIMESYFT